ncbi:MAG: hypothetical protein H7296_12640 [Bacteroidia bacterium]|nr:hypothetical protein [Bacteroidia bacterium]
MDLILQYPRWQLHNFASVRVGIKIDVCVVPYFSCPVILQITETLFLSFYAYGKVSSHFAIGTCLVEKDITAFIIVKY